MARVLCELIHATRRKRKKHPTGLFFTDRSTVSGPDDAGSKQDKARARKVPAIDETGRRMPGE
jgi:hypothetical protein